MYLFRAISLVIVSFVFVAALEAQAYSEFIRYGYASCLTCHGNGLGGGPLNDYGRALWSTEIASRAMYSKNMSAEDLGNQSGFLGKVSLARWLKPHAKYRGINVQTNPGSQQSATKYYNMQNELGFSVEADDDGKYLASITWGHIPRSSDYGLGKSNNFRFLTREYYLRYEVISTWWIYVGLMEKVYGIRNIDHTSYQRSPQGFNPNIDSINGMSHSQGLILHKVEDKWEVALNYFIGNPYESADYKQSGASLMTEFEVGDQKRLGVSVLSEKSELLKKNMAGIFYRQGSSKSTSFLFEYGVIQDKPKVGDTKLGNYSLVEGFISLARGYNLKIATERYVNDSKVETPEQWRWIVGLLAFPAPRFELRLDFVNQRQLSNQGANKDDWSIQQQIHFSL